MPYLPRELTSEIKIHSLKRAAWTLAPLLGLTLITHDPGWLKASVVTISLYIVYERVKLAPLGVICHGLALLLAFMVMLYAMIQPFVFVLICTLTAAGVVGITVYGCKLRTLGNFIFIPSLYLACETAEGTTPVQPFSVLQTALPYLAVAVLPVLALSLAEHMRVSRRWHHMLKLQRNSDLGVRVACGEAVLAVTLAVALAVTIVEWGQLNYGQWIIWSAVSVVTGDTKTARKKLYQRGVGALVGVPVGVLLGYIVPHSVIMYDFLAVAAMLTLVSFSRYTLGFGARCACVASALMVIGQTPEIASERALNVLMGGGIGLFFVFLLHFAMVSRGDTVR